MKKTFRVLLIALWAASPAFAVTLAPGTMETRVAGQLDATSANGTLVELGVSYGYFFRDNLQAGGRVAFFDNDNSTLYSASVFTEYNFEIGSDDWLPFVEGSLGLAHGDGEGGTTETALTFEAQGGVKYFLAPNVALSLALVFDYATAEIYPDDDAYDDSDLRAQLAIRYYY